MHSLTKQLLLCSPISGPSVYQSVSCVSLQPGGNLEHTPAGHSEWTHPRIQGDAQQNKHTHTQNLHAILVQESVHVKENQTAEFKYSDFLSWSHFSQLQPSGTLWEKDKRKIKLEQEFEYHLMVSFYHYSASLSARTPLS